MNEVDFPLVFDADFVDGKYQIDNSKIVYCWDDVLRYLKLENEKNIYVDVYRTYKECNEAFPPTSRFEILIGDAYKIIRYKELSNEWETYCETASYPKKEKHDYIKNKDLCIKDTVAVHTLYYVMHLLRYEMKFYKVILL